MSTFRIQYNGLTIDSDSKFRINQAEGLDGINVRTSSDLLVANNGGNIWKQNYDFRNIAFNGTVQGDDAEDFFNQITLLTESFAISDEDLYLTIRLWDNTEKSIKAKVTLTPQIIHVVGRVNYATFRVELQCPEIYFSDEEATIYTTGVSTSSGYPVASNVPTPVGVLSGGQVTVVNSGSVPTTALIHIDGLVTNATILNSTTGKSFTINTTITAGNRVTLYQDNTGLYVLNGTANYYQYFVGEFFDFRVGSNEIRFSASSSDSNALLTIEFKNKYLSI